ncbi:alpha/beta-hydrolase [Cryphonectria parasitica EP155]|uniref:Alpha/beta-hydrolase n=1 Tax=Cryphonectria parasitica (strain ATCC 38755 / EP155) TaxID=660469 RepID=A0A9P5CQP2_CRYP1|nr:alpha/beta-hydrolase [Cryphonectria parasitica EP155]KAF3766652.1 alpha/beta-hydrolase [Cryphonectria parasitica EP155]
MPTTTDIVLVPGYWEGPTVWRGVVPGLEKDGFNVTTIKLLSTGTPASESPKSPSMYDDIDVIRKAIEEIVDQGKNVVLVGHSAGAFLGSHALQNLTPKAREEGGKPGAGAVVKLAFIAGALFPPGHEHGPAPFMNVQGDKLFCKAPRDLLFNDIVSDEEAQSEVEKLSFQSGFGWDNTIQYAGWLEIPSAYLVCEKDACFPPPLQRQIAEGAKSSPIEFCDAGHMAPITQSKVVVDFIVRTAKSV